MKEEKRLVKTAYVTPKKFAECIDSVFSNTYGRIAESNNIKHARENITVDMLLEWLEEEGDGYAEFIGFFDSFYEKLD